MTRCVFCGKVIWFWQKKIALDKKEKKYRMVYGCTKCAKNYKTMDWTGLNGHRQ